MIRQVASLILLGALLVSGVAAAEPASCQRDSDCDDCKVCRGSDAASRCVDPGAYECKKSEDCDHYELCDFFRDDKQYCGGLCRDWGAPCASDADCPECSICVQGTESRQCRGFGLADCTIDADCSGGQICDLLRDAYPQCGGTCGAEDGKDKTRTEVTGFGCSASASASGFGVTGPGGLVLALLLFGLLHVGPYLCGPRNRVAP